MKNGIKYPKVGATHKLAFSPDGNVIATLGVQVTVWQMSTAQALVKTRPLSNCSRIEWSPDGRQLAVTNTSGHSVLVDPLTGALLRDLKNENAPGDDGADPRFSPCSK